MRFQPSHRILACLIGLLLLAPGTWGLAGQPGFQDGFEEIPAPCDPQDPGPCSDSPFDLALRWQCVDGQQIVGEDYVVDTGAGPGPCLGLSYDGVAESCGDNVFSGAGVVISETETQNSNGTATVAISIASADGSDLIPNGTPCPGSEAPTGAPVVEVNTVVVDLAKQDAGGPGIPGAPLDPNLPNPPYFLAAAKACIFAGAKTLLDFDLNSAGSKVGELRDRFTVSGAGPVVITALQFRYFIAVGDAAGGCILPGDDCVDGMTLGGCTNAGGTYLGDFTFCEGYVCEPPPGG